MTSLGGDVGLTESSGMDVEMTEGIRVTRADGWALVLPDPSEPIVQVYAEGDDAESARALLTEYTGVVEEAIADSP